MSNNRTESGGKVIPLAPRGQQTQGGGRRVRWILVIPLMLLAAVIVLRTLTYHSYSLVSEHTHTDGSTGSYIGFGSGFVRYTNNGMQYINYKQVTAWETSYEMKNPKAVVCGNSTVAVADIKGNQIYICNRKGSLGSITTTMPIQSCSVSEQGVVAVILRSEDQTKMVLYASDGSVLVEGRTSFADTGYPLGIAISPNGEKVLVSYVSVGESISSRLVVYNFENVNASDQERIVMDETYTGIIIPEVAFIDGKSAYAAGNGKLLFFSGSNKFKEKNTVEVSDSIRSVIADGDRVGIITEQTEGENKYSLSLYNTSGRKVQYMDFDDEYNSVYLRENRMILLQGSKCVIYRTNGHQVFSGEFETSVSYIVPIWGVNSYLVAEEGRVEVIRLAKWGR